jgi:hypothetical protein
MGGKTVIGVDPDAEKHGIAIYFDGRLAELMRFPLPILLGIAQKAFEANNNTVVSIEDVMANQFVYARNQHSNKAAQSKIAMHIGRCQQAQVELMRWLDHYGIPYVLHKPQKGNWADKRDLFERITGWTKQSNEDTRAAAYFGYLEALK